MHTRTKRNLRKMAAGFSAFAVLAMPLSVGATADQHDQSVMTYKSHLNELNESGANGHALLQYSKNGQSPNELHVTLNAHDTVPKMVHPMHIHGAEHPEVAFCPSDAQDTNNDGFLSVIEGAPAYGPIKLNLTSPQTSFGTPPTPALFTPFAGTPMTSDFPVADSAGNVHLNQTYVFDQSEAAQNALETLMPLENQHIVIHGAYAPASVDAAAFEALGLPASDPQKVIYDPLLPIACGKIQSHGQQNNQGHQQNDNQAVNNQQNQHQTNQAGHDSQNNQHQNNNQVGHVTQDQNQVHEQNNTNQHQANQNQGGSGQQAEHTAAPAQVVSPHKTAVVVAVQVDAVAVFHTRMAELMHEYTTAKQAAHDTFMVNRHKNHADARDQYVAAVQMARDQHVNHFYEARNMMVDHLNQTGQIELRDQTMHDAEQKLWQFTHEFEMMKQEFLAQHSS